MTLIIFIIINILINILIIIIIFVIVFCRHILLSSVIFSYFTDAVLTKRYSMKCTPDKEDPFGFEVTFWFSSVNRRFQRVFPSKFTTVFTYC